MLDVDKPTILISKCIEGEPCRYDGSMIKDSFISKLKTYVNIIEVCPEVGIGLSTPRDSLRLVGNKSAVSLVCSKTGEDLTEKMIDFSNTFLKSLDKSKIQGIILKGKSPSCGVKDVKLYNNIEKIAPRLIAEQRKIYKGEICDGYKGETILSGAVNSYELHIRGSGAEPAKACELRREHRLGQGADKDI